VQLHFDCTAEGSRLGGHVHTFGGSVAVATVPAEVLQAWSGHDSSSTKVAAIGPDTGPPLSAPAVHNPSLLSHSSSLSLFVCLLVRLSSPLSLSSPPPLPRPLSLPLFRSLNPNHLPRFTCPHCDAPPVLTNAISLSQQGVPQIRCPSRHCKRGYSPLLPLYCPFAAAAPDLISGRCGPWLEERH
jgi:hypothetical protein